MALAVDIIRPWAQALKDLCFPTIELVGEAPKEIPKEQAIRGTDPMVGMLQYRAGTNSGKLPRWSFDWANGQYFLHGQVREAVLGFKFRDEFYHRVVLVEWLTLGFHRLAEHEEWDALVPVPLHPLRRRDRGFNQAEELAMGLSEATGLPMVSALRRVEATQQQALLTRLKRWENTRNAFRSVPKHSVEGKRVLLLDDVLTTGATCEACSRVLRQAGAERIGVLTVARG